ncbi:hypothetical protein TcCL_NonESM08676 [Trypanosoma cruzi]|nr:hypothetical protein TcCL_NonESM08676 [Trypanosoma cruzi]
MHRSNGCHREKSHGGTHTLTRPPISDWPSTTTATALRSSLGTILSAIPTSATDRLREPCTPVPFREGLLPPPTVFPCRVGTRSPLQRNNSRLHSKRGYECAWQ